MNSNEDTLAWASMSSGSSDTAEESVGLGGLAQANAAPEPSKDTAPLPAGGMNGVPKTVVLGGRNDAPVQGQLLGDADVERFPVI
jgi:hypothetical protein